MTATRVMHAAAESANRLDRLLSRALSEFQILHANDHPVIRGVSADSRRIGPDMIFVAVPGTRADGGQFARDAVNRGASAVVIQGTTGDSLSDLRVPVVSVPDARLAVARLAAECSGLADLQRRGEMTVAAVTGTNGKSTVAYMVRAILNAANRLCALFGTIEYDLVSRKLGSELTTPDPTALAGHLVEAHAAGARHAVMEVSSHSLSQRRVDGIEFHVGAFTNLTQDHLDYHGDLDAYLDAKRRLFEMLPAGGIGVVNADVPESTRIVQGCKARIMRFGFGANADIRAEDVREGMGGGRFTLNIAGERVETMTPMIGRHNIANALTAAAMAAALDLDLRRIARGLESLSRVPGRLERVATDGFDFNVFIDYAHTDDALTNVLTAARPLTRGRLWCIFGCGGDRDRSKRPRMAAAVARHADRFVVTSDNPRTEDPSAIIAEICAGLSEIDMKRGSVEPDRATAIDLAIRELGPGDALIIAGKGHEDYQIVGATRHHFDDVEAAAGAVARRRKGL